MILSNGVSLRFELKKYVFLRRFKRNKTPQTECIIFQIKIKNKTIDLEISQF